MRAEHARQWGFATLASIDNPKASKATAYGFLNAILYMAPPILRMKRSITACSLARALTFAWPVFRASRISRPEWLRERKLGRKARRCDLLRLRSRRAARCCGLDRSVKIRSPLVLPGRQDMKRGAFLGPNRDECA